MGEPTSTGMLLAVPLVVAVAALLAAGADAAARGAGAGTPAREVARLLVAQRRRTVADDPLLGRLGTVLVPVAAALAAAVVPLGDRAAVDLGVGVVWFNAMEVLTWVAVWAAGWGPNSTLSLVGGYRFVAQGLAYELPHMFALITPAIAAGSLRVSDVVAAQAGLWFVAWMPAAFVLYLASVPAMAFWGPFAAPLGRDLAGGAVAEHSGVDRLMLEAGRWMLLVVAAGFAVPLFLGGAAPPPGLGGLLPDVRLGGPSGVHLPGVLWVTLKTGAVLAVLIAVRRRLPTLRPDRLLGPAWTVGVPLGVAQALAVSLVVIA